MTRRLDAPTTSREAAGGSRWAVVAGLLLLSVVLVGSVWTVSYLPTNDGPEWIFATHAENHYADAGAPYRESLIPALQFASRGMSAVYGPFEAWLGWERGLQVALSIILLATAWGFVAIVWALEPSRLALGALGFPLALSWEFYIGLWPFVVSSALGLFIVAFAVRSAPATWRTRALLAMLLLAQAVAHVFGAVLTGGALLLLSVGRAPRGKRLAELGYVLLVGLPAAGILAGCVWCSSNLARDPLVSEFQRLPWHDVVAMLPRTFAPGPLGRACVVTALLVAASLVVLRRALRAETAATERALGLAGVALLLTAVCAPYQIPGWQAFSPRFAPLGMALVLACLPVERLGAPWRRVTALLVFGASGLYLSATYPFHQRLVALCPDAVKGLTTSVRRNGQVLSFLFRPTEQAVYDPVRAEVPYLIPLRHMGSLYATVLGAVPATSFAGDPAIHAFTRRPTGRPLPDEGPFWRAVTSYAFSHDLRYRDGVEDQLTTVGAFYDEVVLFGTIPSDVALWHARGFVTDWRSSTTLLAHFEPCTIDLTLPLALADPPPTIAVNVGAVSLLTVESAHAVVESGLAHVTLTSSPCGDVGIHVTRAGAASGTACRNADAAGLLHATITRSSHAVSCED